MSRLLHLLSQLPSQTGSGVFLDNMIQQAHAAGYTQAAVLGLPLSYEAYPFFEGLSVEIYPLFFETPALPFKLPGMSDVMPYESQCFSKMSSEAIDLYIQHFKEVILYAIDTFKPEVLLTNHLWLMSAAAAEVVAAMPSTHNRPKIYAVCHGTDLRQMALNPHLNHFVADRLKTLDGIFSLHDAQRTQIAAHFNMPLDKIHLSGNGYNAQLFFPTQHKDKPRKKPLRIVYAGKLAFAKGLPQLLSAMSQLPKGDFELTLVGRGSGDEAAQILEQAASAKGNVRYAGYLSQSELGDIFRRSDFFVLPSFYEGLPLVVIEALACGLPVVVNDLPGLKEWLGDALAASPWLYFVPMPELEGVDKCKKTAESAYVMALAAAIETCGHSIANNDLQEKPYNTIAERSWENVFKKIETVWGSLGSNAR